jgi:hypothetical protein
MNIYNLSNELKKNRLICKHTAENYKHAAVFTSVGRHCVKEV